MPTYLASERHFIDHLAPIHAFTGGTFLVLPQLAEYAAHLGVSAVGVDNKRIRRLLLATREEGPVVVASFGDVQKVRHGRRPIALLNHGVGQTFTKGHGSYSGGPGREKVNLFIEPNDAAAQKSKAAYPDAAVAVVGSPKLDSWWEKPLPNNREPVIAVSFHWDCRVVPETRSAWPHYGVEALRALSQAYPGRVLGHGHPKIFSQLMPFYQSVGIEPVQDFGEVMERADLYIMDGVSTLYEFAATGRPVVVLNAPWYRRDVEHGLRFWEHATVGVNVDGPEELISGIEEALRDAPEQQALRQRAVEAAYAYRGDAAERAAEAIRAIKTADWKEKFPMSAIVYGMKRVGGGVYSIKGTVNGHRKTVMVEFDRDPSIHQMQQALEEGEAEAELHSPAPFDPVVLDGDYRAVIARLKHVPFDALQPLRALEQKRPSPRKTVIEAIDARLEVATP